MFCDFHPQKNHAKKRLNSTLWLLSKLPIRRAAQGYVGLYLQFNNFQKQKQQLPTLKLCKKKVGPLALSQQNKGPCAAPNSKRGKAAAAAVSAAAESLGLKLINFCNERVTLYPCWW